MSMFEGKMINSVLNLLHLISLWDSDGISKRHLQLGSLKLRKILGWICEIKKSSTSLPRKSWLLTEDGLGQFHRTEKSNEKRGREIHKGPLHSFSMANHRPMLSDLKGHWRSWSPMFCIYRWGDWGPVRETWLVTPSSSTYQPIHQLHFSFSAYPVNNCHVSAQDMGETLALHPDMVIFFWYTCFSFILLVIII